MKEIGGYLEFERFYGLNEWYKDKIKLNTARNAFLYLAKAKAIKKVYLPYFLCDSLCEACKKENIEVEFYHVNRKFEPDFNRIMNSEEYLYIVNYYGQITNDQIIQYKENYHNIVIDNVQAFFQSPVTDVDTIYSCRKFFGVPDGAYLSTNLEYIELECDISYDKVQHLIGRLEMSASVFYSDFKKSEKTFEKAEIKGMSEFSRNILNVIDYVFVKSRREENWCYLHSMLKDFNGLHLKNSEGPYMYPFYSEKASEIRKKLVEKKIYIPTLWPNVLDLMGCDLEKDYALNILPLSCDQRYRADDMKRLAEEVLKCLN